MNASNPELQRILAALQQSSSPGLQANTSNAVGSGNSSYFQRVNNNGYTSYHSSHANTPSPQPSFQIPGLGGEPAPIVQQKPTSTPTRTADPRTKQHAQSIVPARSLTSTPTPSQLTVPDPSSITTWPAALKYITKHIVPNETVSKSIKKLIDSQHTHEETWAKQREEIIARHAGRGENTAKVADLLAELRGVVAISKGEETTEAKMKRGQERDRELDIFDKKVYKNLVAMSRDVDKELRRAGVPFFVIKWDLVTETGGEGKLDKGELRELQGKVVEHLEFLLID